MKLNESLDGHPLMDYYIKGNSVGEPFNYTPGDTTPLHEGYTIDV